MTENSIGKKHRCAYCGTKFYDLNKKPILCPNCGKNINDQELDNLPDAESVFMDGLGNMSLGENEVLDVEGIEETLVPDPITPTVADEDL